ncbi:VOC family protein [Arvimicrobium flavum]|uniref:VOC family protein n=1 Tax=Arvimicrobium flavum TaxID=3393320 RepID=UPI00237B50D8|nr:VOC family protein [Mesorhizobium shangrilense]
MTDLPFSGTTPISVSRVGLRARDAEGLASYYKALLGLEELTRSGGDITLGAAGRPLLVLESAPKAKPDDPRSAGLFHTAFLFPSRADLGRWIKHAAQNRIRVEGASDHLVSEALYLTDPEGNGIEIYADRPKEAWSWEGQSVAMATERLDVEGVVASVPADQPDWKGAPENTIVGHVHLRVGDPLAAERFWHQEYGFDTVAKYGPAAVFLSSGGYHHHIGANIWQSARAGRRDDERSGLSWVELRATDPKYAGEKRDPWGTVIRTIEAMPG